MLVLSEPTAVEVSETGGKGASLARLSALGYPFRPGSSSAAGRSSRRSASGRRIYATSSATRETMRCSRAARRGPVRW